MTHTKHVIEVSDRGEFWDVHIYRKRGESHASVLIGKSWESYEIANALAFLANNLSVLDTKKKLEKR